MGPVRSRLRASLVAIALALFAAVPAGAERADAEITPELQKQINEAIDKGQAWLVAQQKPDGSFQPLTVVGTPAYQVGVTALVGLALIAAGEPKKGPVLQKILAYVKEADLKRDGPSGARSTYGTGVLIMFLTEMFRPEEKPEKEPGRYAAKPKKDPCKLPEDVAAWIRELALWLVDVQMQDGWWRYPHTPPSDLSNTQYALLGLRAARDCGIAIQQMPFYKALQRTLEVQQKDGPKVPRIIPATKPGETEYATGNDKARGWNYQAQDGQPITGSMTTAALAVLAIARDACLKPERFSAYSVELDNKVQFSVQDGFAWLDKNFAVDKNPPAGAPAWHYYYLYGLERACAYAGREKIGKHDWYKQGASFLVSKQQKDGRWQTGALGAGGEIGASDLCDTAWAVLFLKRATRPMPPIPVPTVTEGD
jgi:hypothetical protein